MIETPTTLVLGAGASVPYRYPTGGQLIDRILAQSKEGSNLERLLANADLTPGATQVDAFREALQTSQQPSVDALIHRRPEFATLGKLAIAYALLGFEHTELLASDRATEKIGGWYGYLFERIDPGRDGDVSQNKIQIVTFNYDRSLEVFLARAFQCSYGLSENESFDWVDTIPIIHVYGKLDRYGPRAPKRAPYSGEPTDYEVRQASDCIHLVNEEREENPNISRAVEALRAAERVCFLGFGFHPDNLTVLGNNNALRTRAIFSSSYGLPEDMKRLARRRLGDSIKFASPNGGGHCAATLRELPVFDLG